MKKRKKYKSVITQRIFKSVKKLATVFCFLLLIIGIGKIQGTSSFFSNTASSTGNTFSAGYWIVPEIEVTSPKDGDEWQVGSEHNITWTIKTSDPLATITDLDLDYSCDDGVAYEDISNFSDNPGSYNWTIPKDISDKCRLKIVATDSNGLIGNEESDNFKIKSPIVLNEILPDPAGADNSNKDHSEFVELFNNDSVSHNLNGWRVYIGGSDYIEINNTNTDGGGTIVDAQDRLVVWLYKKWSSSEFVNSSDTVSLYDGPKASSFECDSYTYSYSGSKVDNSFVRNPDGTGDWEDSIPSPGKKNKMDDDRSKHLDYYKEICFDNGKPICEKDFMESLGLFDEIAQKKEDAVVEIKTQNEEKIIPEIKPPADPLAVVEETDDPIVSPVVPVLLAPAPIIELDPIVIKSTKEEKTIEKKETAEEEKTRLEAEAKAKKEAEEKAKAEEEAKLEAEKKAEEEKAKKEAEEKAKKEEDHTPEEEA